MQLDDNKFLHDLLARHREFYLSQNEVECLRYLLNMPKDVHAPCPSTFDGYSKEWGPQGRGKITKVKRQEILNYFVNSYYATYREKEERSARSATQYTFAFKH